MRFVFECCLLEVKSCSVKLDVTPHSATSSANGDDTSTTVAWNSGVNSNQYVMWVYTLVHDASQMLETPGHVFAPSCS